MLECDLHDVYGIDMDDRTLLHARSWRWMEARILGLLAADTRLHRALVLPRQTATSMSSPVQDS